MKVVIYILCYDDDSAAHAARDFQSFPWARIVTLPDDPRSAKYMEGAAYLDTLSARRAEWEDADFVGTLSWRALDKIKIPADLLDHLAEAHKQQADVVAFLPSTEHVIKQALRSHPRFLEIWLPLLQKLGHTAQDAVHTDMPCMLCNYWVASPAWMTRFLEFYTAAVDALEALPEVREALWSDAGYGSQLPIERRQQVFGTPYIPHHPFVGERLAGFFFWKEQARIALMSLATRAFWEKHYNWEAEDVIRRAQHLTHTFQLQ